MGSESMYAGLRDLAVKAFIGMLAPSIRCPVCKFPLRAAFAVRWRSNGTITPIFVRRYIRMVMLPTGFYDSLFARIEDFLGVSIDHILFEAQRNISQSMFDSLEKVIFPIKLLKRLTLMQRFAVEGYSKIGVVSGMAHATTVEHVPGDHVTKRIINPYNIHLLSANSVGGLEYLEGHPFNTEIVNEGNNSYLLKLTATSEKPAISQRLRMEKPVLVPGNIKYEKCFLCRTPVAVSSRFKSIEDEGKIIDTLSNSRVVMMDGFLLNTVLRELVKEVGDEIYDLLVQAQCEWTIEHVQLMGRNPGDSGLKGEEFKASFKDYLDDMPVFGYGNPVSFEMNDLKVEVLVENPFQEEVIAGMLQGLYRVFSGEECRVSWTSTGKATVLYSLEPGQEQNSESRIQNSEWAAR